MIDVVVPFEQEGTKAIVRSWLKNIGDVVAENDPLVELETDKVTQEVPAPAAGVLLEIFLDTDAEALPGAVLGRLGSAAAELPPTANETPATIDAPTLARDLTPSSSSMGLSPSVRRAVLQYGVDADSIAGTGRGGRITRADVDHAVAARAQTPPKSAAIDGTRTVPHDRMRLAIAENMLNSVTLAPHVTAVFEADFSAIISHRRKHKAGFEKEGIALTLTAYLVAACVEAMRAAPTINSRWFDDRLEVYENINVGIGTALGEKGLVVPVVRDVQELSLRSIAERLSDLTARARSNKLTATDMRGGTFTISNHGVSGSLLATPIIIVQPQSAILGVGKLQKRVVVREVDGMDSIQIRPMCFVSLTIDHRVVDGHQTNAWLSKFVEKLEAWPLA